MASSILGCCGFEEDYFKNWSCDKGDERVIFIASVVITLLFITLIVMAATNNLPTPQIFRWNTTLLAGRYLCFSLLTLLGIGGVIWSGHRCHTIPPKTVVA